MTTMSIRTMQDLAYERGEEFDPALVPTPDVIEELSTVGSGQRPIEAPSPYERRRAQQRARREAVALVPDWFSLDDLFDRPSGVHGELV